MRLKKSNMCDEWCHCAASSRFYNSTHCKDFLTDRSAERIIRTEDSVNRDPITSSRHWVEDLLRGLYNNWTGINLICCTIGIQTCNLFTNGLLSLNIKSPFPLFSSSTLDLFPRSPCGDIRHPPESSQWCHQPLNGRPVGSVQTKRSMQKLAFENGFIFGLVHFWMMKNE